MPDRIAWQRTDQPDRFAASVPEGGTAELWFHAGAQGTRGWHWRIRVGQATESSVSSDRQAASDEANRMLPGILAKERARLVKLEARDELHRKIEAAYDAGRVDVMAFAPRSADRDELQAILDFLRHRNWLDGTMQPLREAVSEELYRRRMAGR